MPLDPRIAPHTTGPHPHGGRRPSNSLSTITPGDLQQKCDALLAWFQTVPDCAVALSAGVDSTVVAKAARLALGSQAVAVTADTPSLPRSELQLAQQLAETIDIRHVVIPTGEIDQQAYRRNHQDRCFHCKTELYRQMEQIARQLQVRVLANGANTDDLGDYRPGLEAAKNHQVRSPLIECGLSKADVRALAQHWNLPNWDKPAAPCLSSRIAYGVEVTPERLSMIEQGEAFLGGLGLREFRLRFHEGDVARIEVPAEEILRLCQPDTRNLVVEKLQALGFRFVTLDLQGFRSGSLNSMIPVEQLMAAGRPERPS